MLGRRNFFDQLDKTILRTYDKIWKIATGYRNDYTSACLLDYPYFKNCYKMVAIDLSKQKNLDSVLRAIQQINFTGNNNVFHY